MREGLEIEIVGCHAEGEVGDVITGGVETPPGATIADQARFIAEDGALRAFVLNEPRGGVFRHVNLLVPPIDPRADVGWIIMEPADTPPMSGSNSICVATVVVQTGRVPMREPETIVRLEPPAGVIEARVACRNGKVERVSVRNVPSFTTRLDAPLEVAGRGTLSVDVAYGGDSFVIVDAAALGAAIEPSEARELAELGVAITQAANDQLGFAHPAGTGWDHISFCQFAAPMETIAGVKTGRNAVAIRPGKIDRSPTGTGCSARMATLFARGLLEVGEPFAGLSILGSRFDCRILDRTQVAGTPAIVPEISGRAWITGESRLTLDPDDPWPGGYRLSDTWPDLL